MLREFFGEALGKKLAAQGHQADLIVGNNVYAHVPDINDFTRGLKALLKPGGTITLEFPHLMRMIADVQFDTAYHEHFSYLSLYTVRLILAAANLRVAKVEELSTHGGSLRVYVVHENDTRQTDASVSSVLETERRMGLRHLAPYLSFQSQADRVKNELTMFLLEQKCCGKSVAAYGAAAKGNTLLNYAGIKPDLLPYVCDAAPAKQGKFLPGSHIRICEPGALDVHVPDYVLILPWNIANEVRAQLVSLARRGTRFVLAVPHLEIV